MAKGTATTARRPQGGQCVCDMYLLLVILELVVGVLLAIIGIFTLLSFQLNTVVSGVYIA